jgi:alkanesulfonate monooxygenase SsuD/methylene tetrahydromethanopterin reductase-like flavin-dependent oxidoreductase (luciferase family)
MHFGLIMECDYRYGNTLQESFDEAFQVVDAAESGGLDGVWLAERHFAAPRDPLDPMGGGIPSIVSAPLIMASAIAARLGMPRIGSAGAELP